MSPEMPSSKLTLPTLPPIRKMRMPMRLSWMPSTNPLPIISPNRNTARCYLQTNFRCNISPTPTDYTVTLPFRVAVPTPNPALQPSRISCIWSNLTTSRKSITWKSAVRRLQRSSANRPEQPQPFSNPATRLHRPTSTTGKPMSA